MKESVGYTVTLNIMIVFITIVITFLCAALIYFKSNKASNIITGAIEKYEEYDASKEEIKRQLFSLGYGSHSIQSKCELESVVSDESGTCSLLGDSDARGINGYCVYICYEEDNFNNEGIYIGEYYHYRIRTNMMVTIPILNNLIDIPIYSNTNRLYNFDKVVNP